MAVLALAEAFLRARDPVTQPDAAQLVAALVKAASGAGKENSCGGLEAAQQCFKTAQQRLSQAQDGDNDPAALAPLVAVGRASLAAATALAPATLAPQLATSRYNFARRLVSCKAFADAQAEAWLLFQQLGAAQPTSGGGSIKLDAAPGQLASMMVGTCLTLVLCYAEGRLLGCKDALQAVLASAESLPTWLRQLAAGEAARHGDAAHKYLYKVALLLLERQAWQALPAVCGSMLAAAGGEGKAQQRALQAAGKLAGHMPEAAAAATAASLADRASRMQLSHGAAVELLGLLCSAVQHVATAPSCEQLERAVLSCMAAACDGSAALQSAVLLLPALAVQLPGSGPSAAAWLVPVSTYVQLVAATIQQLGAQQQAAAQPLLLGSLQQHTAVLEAAFPPANTLRRVLSSQLSADDKAAAGSPDAVQRLGGGEAASLVASALELLPGMVGVTSRQASGYSSATSALGSQGHAAAVGLVTAVRLRAACLQGCPGAAAAQDVYSSQAAGWLLGWDLQSYRDGSAGAPCGGCPLEPQELAWMASALFNAGVDLHAGQRFAAAASAVRAAVAAVVVGLAGDRGDQDATGRLSDFCRKAAALADCLQRAGDAPAALHSLAHCTALLLQLGFEAPAGWQPLVQVFVRLRAEQPLRDEPTAAAAPGRRGRAKGGKRGAASPDTGSSSPAGDEGQGLVGILARREAALPEGSLAAAAEQELACWAAHQGSAAGVAHLRRVVQSLLRDVFAVAARPAEHAGVLLALHQLGLPAEDGCTGDQLLERAAGLLQQAPGAAAALTRARTLCVLAVSSARQLASQTLLEQQQERQRSHAAASTSAAGSSEQDAAALGQLAGQADEAAWQRVAAQAQQALEALRAAGTAAAAADASTAAAFQELAWLLGMHGSHCAAAELHQLLPGLQPGADAALAGCLFPSACGASAAGLDQQAEAAALAGARSGNTVVGRAALHRQAAEAFAAAGDMVPALYHASEAHRLLATLFHGGPPSGTAPPTSSSSADVGWWQLAALYLASLMQLGQLFEASGLADEAVHALREGQRLAVAAASRPLAALFVARLAEVCCKQGQLEAAKQAASMAVQQLDGVQAESCLPLAYCRAAVHLVSCQLGLASSIDARAGKAALRSCQAALDSCAAAAAQAAGHAAAGWCAALHAAALLTAAQAALQQGDRLGALERAAAALAAAESAEGGCSALRQQRASALLFLGQHAAPTPPAQQHAVIWGLGLESGARAADSPEAPLAARSSTKKAPGKQPAGRGHGKAATAAAGSEAASSPPHAALGVPPPQQQLWQALELSQGLVCIHRSAALLLTEACGTAGLLRLAAWLLHCTLGGAMRLQYQLVLYSRARQLLQRVRRAAPGGADAVDVAAQACELQRLAADVLAPGLDWQLVRQLAGCGGPATQRQPAAAARGRKAAAGPSSAAAPDAGCVLAALDQQAGQQLLAWQAALPPGTAACSISLLPGSDGGSLLLSRLAPAAGSGAAQQPPLLLALPVRQLSASLSQHPIRALQMDEDDGNAASPSCSSSVQSVLDEMAALLEDSGRSMRQMSTDTREQQREWWRARLALDDRLAALVRHLDASWLGPWRSLLLGEGSSGAGDADTAGHAAAEHLLGLLAAAGQPHTQQRAGVLRHATAVLARHASRGGMTAGEQRQAAQQMCWAAGLACSPQEAQGLAALLCAEPPPPQQQRQGGHAAAAGAAAQAPDVPDSAPVAGGRGRRATAKSVKFADQAVQAAAVQQQQAKDGAGPEPASAPARGSKARRAAPARPRRGAADGAATPPADPQPAAVLAAAGSAGDADEPPATVARGGLCHVFGGLSLEDGASTAMALPSATAGGTAAARSGKHRSRLRMMQAGPGTALKQRAAAGAATAPRPAREVPLTAARTAPPPARARDDAAGGAAAGAQPVLLVLEGTLQALPWECAPGLLHQRAYRMPSLACAAATSQRAGPSVDLTSTYYALNPSGDLEATQATFQAWFAAMQGWEGKSGSAPSAAELAAALQSRQFFLYCGHGGGEQYISAAKLRSLGRCAAALLMGCSSGRLRVAQHYESSGAVLAYLLAGCPTAVANLWDVTDKDIDRFSQALLTGWLSGGAAGGGDDASGGVAAARAACKLPHLVGAAPVCYGIPSRVHFAAASRQAE